MPGQKGFATIFLVCILGLLIIGGIYYLLQSNHSIFLRTNKSNSTGLTPPQTTVRTSEVNLNDAQTKIYFADKNTLYRMTLDGLKPLKIYSFIDSIQKIQFIPNSNNLFVTTISDIKSADEKRSTDWLFTFDNTDNFTPKKISTNSDQNASLLAERLAATTKSEHVYAKALPDGTSQIYSDPLDGSQPVKIGLMKKSLVTVQPCEGNNPPVKVYPTEFIPSLDGSLLINKGVSGPCEVISGVVISRDGNTIYNFDFNWYATTAIWISNNQLLTTSKNGPTIFTFSNGKVQSKVLNEHFDSFTQEGLSPNHKFLAIINPNELNLYDIEKQKLITVDKFNNPSSHNTFGIVGWNSDSTKLLYSKTSSNELKLFDLTTNKSYTMVNTPFDKQLSLLAAIK